MGEVIPITRNRNPAAERSRLWADLEFHERKVEEIRRQLGLLATEHGLAEQ